MHGEADLRLIDVSALLNVPMPKEGSMTFAGRYGFPNLILGAIDVDADVDFWDYQYRTGVDMSPRSRFEVVALGGRDRSVFDASDPDERLAFDLQFHRFDARFVGRVKRWDFVGTMLYGYDFSEVEDASGLAVADARANLHRFGPRFWAIFGAPKAQLRIGGEMSALFGPVQCVGGVQNISTPCDEDFLEQENRRIIGGAFVDSNISALSWLDVSLGLRVDVWNTGGYRDAGVSPRTRVTFHAKDVADIFFGWGLGYRPATFAIPLPGLGDVPLEAGLQRANQTEGGVRFFLPHDITFETRGYLNLYRDLPLRRHLHQPGDQRQLQLDRPACRGPRRRRRRQELWARALVATSIRSRCLRARQLHLGVQRSDRKRDVRSISRRRSANVRLHAFLRREARGERCARLAGEVRSDSLGASVIEVRPCRGLVVA